MIDTFRDGDLWAAGGSTHDSAPEDSPHKRFRRAVFGKTATHCAYCGDEVLDDIGFRVNAFQVYCSEEHAVADQENNPL